MENSKRGTIPMQEKLKLSKSQGASTRAKKQRMQNVPYASAVRSIMYVVRCTRPNVAFAYNITSRFQQNPGELHWTTVKNILKYLRNTKDMFLVYGGDMKRELRVSCYTDAGYLTDADDLKSQTGYVFVLNEGVVDWKSTKQGIFATSSTDAEYIAAFDASKVAVWIRKFISRLNVVPIIEETINMCCDNIGAIAIAKDHGITKGARHFRAKVHYLRETIEMVDDLRLKANNSLEWRQAIKEEYDALMKNGTWYLVPRASNTNVVDGKWVYRLKRDKNGAITRYKARFVAKGFRQQLGIDFHETFSLVVKSTAIRSVLSLAVTNDWPLCQLDIQNAFLHGYLKEQVYMKQPPGFIDPQRPNHVCLLHKSLYGLKHASCAWFERLSKALFDLGFKGSKTKPSLFIYSCRDALLYILVYVDGIIITSNNKGTISNIICQLGSAFALKDLGLLNYFLGIEIVLHVSDILLSQKKYILELLQSAGLSNCNPVSSPMVTSSSLSLDDNTAFSNPVKYRQVVGSLQYVTLSRSDIVFAVNKVCQYMHASTENHWSAVKQILRNPDTSLEAFSDADWTGDSDDRRSMGGFAIYLGSHLISWTARKQCTVLRSSTEAEYKALADTVVELTWLQALLNELGIRSSSTPILWCDNLGATYLSANPIFHAHTKQVEIDYHFVREKVNIFTKPLPTPRFLFLRSKLQVVARP
ncbi:putative RNA-directed DNA polymerase [Tanacetum coccineum]